jgi:PTS system mannose-specific IIA component
MIGVVLVTHGELGAALLDASAWITGAALKGVVAVPIDGPHDPRAQAEQIARAVHGFEGGAVILTDLFGGTPQNLALTLLSEGSVDVVSGVNLPMLLAIPGGRDKSADAHALALHLQSRGRGGMVVAGETLKRHAEASKELPAVSP